MFENITCVCSYLRNHYERIFSDVLIMPAADAIQLVRAAIERNREIPAVLDAYGEFIDSPLGPLNCRI